MAVLLNAQRIKMKAIELKEIHTGGLHLGIKYYANDKQIERAEYFELKRIGIANESYSSAHNQQNAGVWSFYCTVKV